VCVRSAPLAPTLAMSWGQLIQIGGDDVTDDIQTRWIFPSNISEVIIGRLEENSSYVINKPYVSAKHLSIIRSSSSPSSDAISTFTIHDYSSNGTYLNGELIGKGNSRALCHNDLIQFKFRGIEKLIFKFLITETTILTEKKQDGSLNRDRERDRDHDEGPPQKKQNINKRNHSSLHENNNNHSNNNNNSSNSTAMDSSLTKRINILEREMQQQEIRIANQSTKLESSAREYGNLQTTYLSVRELLNEKENELTEAKQTRLILESSLAAMEARCRNLDESIANMKTQVLVQLSAVLSHLPLSSLSVCLSLPLSLSLSLSLALYLS
jgi:pSer/pThr/pTyr-binding forkhead associated (FHA) protein